jgi:NNP family nitrate/nitrite transporter-like MFS transporter
MRMKGGTIQLPLQTLSLVAGFMVWVLLSSLLPFIKEDIHLASGQIAWVTATPVILGSVLRVPIGYFTNRFGARTLFALSFLILIAPLYYLSRAATLFDLIAGGLFLGIGGAVFSAGVTSLPKYYSKEKHGLVNGLYGMGNIGTAVTSFSAPMFAKLFGWAATVQLTIGIMALFALLNFLFGDRSEPKSAVPLKPQLQAVSRKPKLWLLSLFYFITFGSFVAFTVYLPNFLVNSFQLDKVDAGLRTAGFIALCTLVRPLGGWLADRRNAFVVLMFVFAGLTVSGVVLSFSPSLLMYSIGCLLVAFCAGIGNGAIFKLVPLYFAKEGGIANGVVAMFGGLGGFFPPLVLSFVQQMTGHVAIGFMALSEFALAGLILTTWLYGQERLQLARQILDSTTQGMLVTDKQGIIRQVNPAFTALTGFTEQEAIGQTPAILKSGEQDRAFYDRMWRSIREKGSWQGEIVNRRKNGESFLEWLTISTIANEPGDVKKYAGLFSDITADRPFAEQSEADGQAPARGAAVT